MSRLALMLVACILLPVAFLAPPAAAAGVFDAGSAASVWGAALAYIAPRSLQAVSIPQMTIWGLNGLAALDPDLNTTLQDGQIRLYGPDQLITAVPAPPADDPAGWGKAAAAVAAAAFAASPALQQAGTQGLISSFFDELFNHFDPYSRYEPPLQAAQDQLMITGLGGTGLTLGVQSGHVVITAIAADSPAMNAGLGTGTVVLAMDGAPAYPAAVARLNQAMEGIPGSSITLRLADPGDPASAQSVTLLRTPIPPDTVFPEAPPAPGVLALKITGFNRGTSDEFSSALAAAFSANPAPAGLLIDLRGNRGGVLRQAVLVADSLLPRGRIAEAAGRDPDADQLFLAEGSDLTGDVPLVVLVDGQTASAAEILSAAIADNGRGVVVGSETLGKGLVQTLTALPDGGELYVTWSRVLAPLGWPLQSLGVMPQVCTSLGEAALNNQLAALADGRNLLASALAESRAMRAPAGVDAILAVRDQCPADIGADLDRAAAAALFRDPRAYQAALLP